MRDHFAILKVGPGATFALRETLWGLAAIEQALHGDGRVPDLRKIVVATMRADPQHWRGHYDGDGREPRPRPAVQPERPHPLLLAVPGSAARRRGDAASGSTGGRSRSRFSASTCRASTTPCATGASRARRPRSLREGIAAGAAALHRCLRPPVEGGRMSTNGFPGLPAAELEVARRGLDGARDRAAAGRLVGVGELVARRARGARWLSCSRSLANPRLRVVLTGAGTSAYIGDCLAPALSARLRPARRGDRDHGTRSAARTCGCRRTARRCSSRSRAPATVPRAWPRSSSRSSSSPAACSTSSSPATRKARWPRARGDCRMLSVLLMPEAAHDRGFAMTSSFSAMLLAGALAFGLVDDDAPRRLAPSPRRSCCRRRRRSPGAWSRAASSASCTSAATSCAGLASEAALKLLELTDGRVVAVSDSTLGFRHGPKTIINDRTLVVVLLSNDALRAGLRRATSCGSWSATGAPADCSPSPRGRMASAASRSSSSRA